MQMCSSTMNNQGTELIYEATLRRTMLYGIHIQGTVIDNHGVLWRRSRGSRARQMILKRAAGCYDGGVSRKIVIRMNRGQSVATMNSGETAYLCNHTKMLMMYHGWVCDWPMSFGGDDGWLLEEMRNVTVWYQGLYWNELRWNCSNYKQHRENPSVNSAMIGIVTGIVSASATRHPNNKSQGVAEREEPGSHQRPEKRSDVDTQVAAIIWQSNFDKHSL